MADGSPLSALIRFAPPPIDKAAGLRARQAVGDCDCAEFIAGVAGCSPYLARLIERAPETARLALGSSPAENSRRVIAAAWKAADDTDVNRQMQALRLAKTDAALSLAFAEISGACSTMQSAAALSGFADAAIGAAARMALRQVERLGFRPRDAERPEEACGLVVLAMGKLGAFELNYSSDIDLVILFDGAGAAFEAGDEKRIAVAAARAVVARLNDQTADGYVFRTDLRLRPDPGVSAAAVSINAAETYYESYGQNWERSAYIKARAAAGDLPLGRDFIRRLRPFIWRKYLDFAAIEEIHAVMRQIHAARRASESEFYGSDLKRGPGGIREIEFFAQAQQLIGGGKNPALRRPATLEALEALAAASVVERTTAEALAERYRYLRAVEHRLQMISDEQTHRIPTNRDEAARLAAFLGEDDVAAFERRLVETYRETRRLTAPLFRAEAREKPAISLSFSGVDNDPATIATLRRLGFQRPEQVADSFRRWQAGEARATRSQRARALLAKAAPEIVTALSRAGAPDDAFAAFDGFLRGLPAGVQIFALFLSRPDVFERLVRLMTVSPYLAREVAKRPYLAEALIESRWPEAPRSREDLEAELSLRLAPADGFEAALNTARRWALEEMFAVSAQLLSELIAPSDAACRFTLIAETSLGALLAAAKTETERLYGAIAGDVAVVGLGRLGAKTMTAASDVDLMFIYDAPEGARSSGASALDAVTWYARLVRRFLSAVTTPTEEGVLYEADMQLRPSGAKGPAAVSLSAFRRYYEEAAWTWEIMALTKARVIAGGAVFGARAARAIAAVLAAPRDAGRIARDADAMRERLRAAKPAADAWNLKTAVGGFVEVDFILQYLVLAHPSAMQGTSPYDFAAALEALEAAGAIDARHAAVLRQAQLSYEAAHQLARAATGGVFAPGAAGDALRRMMAAALETQTIEEAQAKLAALQSSVRAAYDAIVVEAKVETA